MHCHDESADSIDGGHSISSQTLGTCLVLDALPFQLSPIRVTMQVFFHCSSILLDISGSHGSGSQPCPVTSVSVSDNHFD